MHTTTEIRIEGFAAVNYALKAWYRKWLAVCTPKKRVGTASGLDAHVEYDIGLSDCRRLPPKSGRPKRMAYPVTAETLLNR
ncbi:MAG: hypothetical protein ACREDX_07220 [Aestuariivirga sp.]